MPQLEELAARQGVPFSACMGVGSSPGYKAKSLIAAPKTHFTEREDPRGAEERCVRAGRGERTLGQHHLDLVTLIIPGFLSPWWTCSAQL